MAVALLNARVGYSPGIHTSITGGMSALIGYNLLLLGAVADIILSKRLGLQPHSITQKLMRLTPPKAIAIGLVLVLIGLAYLTFLAIQWAESGYCRLPLRGENMIALTAIALGVEIAFTSFLFRSIHAQQM